MLICCVNLNESGTSRYFRKVLVALLKSMLISPATKTIPSHLEETDDKIDSNFSIKMFFLEMSESGW